MDHDMPFKTPELDDPVLEWATCGINNKSKSHTGTPTINSLT